MRLIEFFVTRMERSGMRENRSRITLRSIRLRFANGRKRLIGVQELVGVRLALSDSAAFSAALDGTSE